MVADAAAGDDLPVDAEASVDRRRGGLLDVDAYQHALVREGLRFAPVAPVSAAGGAQQQAVAALAFVQVHPLHTGAVELELELAQCRGLRGGGVQTDDAQRRARGNRHVRPIDRVGGHPARLDLDRFAAIDVLDDGGLRIAVSDALVQHVQPRSVAADLDPVLLVDALLLDVGVGDVGRPLTRAAVGIACLGRRRRRRGTVPAARHRRFRIDGVAFGRAAALRDERPAQLREEGVAIPDGAQGRRVVGAARGRLSGALAVAGCEQHECRERRAPCRVSVHAMTPPRLGISAQSYAMRRRTQGRPSLSQAIVRSGNLRPLASNASRN